MRNTLFIPVALAGLLAATAQAQIVVGNDQSGTATIWQIDVTSGASTPIYSSSTSDAKPWGMAFDASTGTLYWNNGSTLYSSPLQSPLVPTNLGTMMFNAATVNFVALSFANGKLYGTRNITTEAVYEIDPGTLVATQLYVYPSTFDFGGLDHDPSTGLLYGVSDSSTGPAGRGLYQIDAVAQTTTFIAPYPAGETDIDGLAVANGLAYYVTDGPNTTQTDFYVFDIATGLQVNTIPSPFTGSGTFAAATWVGSGGGGPVVYCTAGTSTNGCVPAIDATGTPSVSASSGFTLDVTNVEGQKQGLLFYGISGRIALSWGTSSSFLCVKAPTQRMGNQNTGGTLGLCDGAVSQDWLAFVAAGGVVGAPFSSGTVVNAQFWYRDPPSPKTTMLSDGLEFTTQP